jgi:subtilisin family serine protease
LQECLHSQLKQLPQLFQLPDNVTGAHFSLPAAGSARAQCAKQAHALALAEAKVGSKWWLPLKALDQQLRDAAAAAEQDASTGSGAASKAAAGGLWGSAGSTGVLQQEWQQQEKVWKDSWQRIREEEQRRPSLQEMMEQQEALRPHVVIEQELNSESSWHAAASGVV